jgi:hypothetical protein
LALVDWHQAYFRLCEKKRLRGWHNAVVRPQALRVIVADGCEFIAEDGFFQPTNADAIARLQETVCEALEAWFERDYRLQQKRFETRHMSVSKVSEAQAQYPPYKVLVRVDEQNVIDELTALADELGAGCNPDWASYTLVHKVRFDRHLYQPLLIAVDSRAADTVSFSPKLLEKSEREFVHALADYWDAEREGALAGHRLYLLRNQSRGRGLGFYENEGFFPDFILWDVGPTRQRILFIEPHGLQLERLGSDKISGFHTRLQEYVADGLAGAGRSDIEVDGWIISETPFSELRRQWDMEWSEEAFEERHILFPHGKYADVIRRLLTA